MPSDTVDAILANARQRAHAESLPYAGALTPSETFTLLQQAPEAILVDVRTQAERDWVGRVAIPESQHAAIEWNLYPGGVRNTRFMEQLASVATPERIVVLLCRSGVRSHQAAQLAVVNGYPHCFNILGGFEGDKDETGHRKTIGGWCVAGLPWVGA